MSKTTTEWTETDQCIGPSLSVDCMINKLQHLPEPQYLFRGIIEPSIGVFFGPSKSGKTTLVENLLISVAAGITNFLGDPLMPSKKRVLIISLEEFYRNRTARNKKQIEYYNIMYDLNPSWSENIFVIDDSFPRYFCLEEHWTLLEKEIERVQPVAVMIDSLTRLTVDAIEDSTVASKLMKRLREIAYKHKVALIIIHHSQKLDNKPVTLASLAGSRVVGQELDFIFGVNRTNDNTRYLKDVAFRYAPDDSDHVLKFGINEQLAIESMGKATETDIINGSTGTITIGSDNIVFQFIQEYTQNDISVAMRTKDFYERLVETGVMTRPTLHAALNRLEKTKIIQKVEKGLYALKPFS